MDAAPLIVIPARMASTRLPGKPLADIHGQPMIVHVWRRAMESGVGRVVVACAEEEIAAAVRAAGGEAVLTDPALPSGSDRVWQAVQSVDASARHGVIINLQGDMPTLDAGLVGEVAQALSSGGTPMATLAAPITHAAEISSPHVVKPVVAWDSSGMQGRALYFTRATAPHGEGDYFHHIGMYAYLRAALERFVHLPPSPLEQREKLEQLRALEAAMAITVRRVHTVPLGVDTPEDLHRARVMLAAP